MTRSNAVPIEFAAGLRFCTSGRFQHEMIDAAHVGWLLPTEDPKTRRSRCEVFDRIREDVLESWEAWTSPA